LSILSEEVFSCLFCFDGFLSFNSHFFGLPPT
jgi:hypothetical protein